MSESGKKQLRAASGLYWVKDATQTLVVEEAQGRTLSLHGFDAALWDWLNLEYSYEQILELATALLDAPAEEAKARVGDILEGWIEIGLLL